MTERADDIPKNLASVRARINEAARAAGRDPAGVTLVAVSKTWPAEDIRHAYEAGQRDFGENYAQELAQKRDELADLTDIRWHFIGALQSNKAKFVVPGCALVHAIDRPSVAKAASRRAQAAGAVVDALIEVNVDGEESKAGLPPEEVDAFAETLSQHEGLRVVGLMCIPLPSDVPQASRAAFQRLRELLMRLKPQHAQLSLLSMGMSDDFEVAISEGATHVRVGSAIFGQRARG